MKRYVLTQWKAHKATVALIIFGFFIADLILSVGVTVSRRQFEYYHDGMIGNPDEQLVINFRMADGEKTRSVLETVSGFGEVQVLNADAVPVENGDAEQMISPVPVWFEREEDWHIPIIKGRYLSAGDMDGRERVAVLGKEAATELHADTGQMIRVRGEEYLVIGIAGRTYRETQWDDVMYVPCGVFYEGDGAPFSNDVSVLLKSGRERFAEWYGTAGDMREGIQYEEISGQMDASGLRNAVSLTVILSVCVFAVAIVNISNLMLYWVLERRNTYGIIKALGGYNGYIFKLILCEVLALTAAGSLLALAVQQAVHLLADSLPLELELVNVGVSAAVAVLTGFIAALIPAVRAVRLQPVEVLNEGDV